MEFRRAQENNIFTEIRCDEEVNPWICVTGNIQKVLYYETWLENSWYEVERIRK